MARTESKWGSERRLKGGGGVEFRYTADTGDGTGRRQHSVTIKGTRREIDRQEAVLRAKYDTGRDGRVSPTFSAMWSNRLVETEIASLADTTRRAAVVNWENFVRPRWGRTRMDAVTHGAVQEWIGTLSATTARNAVTNMRRCARAARAYDLVSYCAVDDDNYVYPEKASKGEGIVGDLETYLLALDSAQLLAAAIVMGAAGCRPGEALAVHASDVVWNGEEGQVEIPVLDQSTGGGGLRGRLKNCQSARIVAVKGKMASALLRLAGEASARGDEYLCDDGFGNPLGTQWFYRHWRRCLEEAGLEYHQPRTLRSYFATTMLEHGMSTRDANKSLGHLPTSPLIKAYDRPDLNRPVPAIDVW